MLNREGIRIRDSFIHTDRQNGYYMYGTTACREDGKLKMTWSNHGPGIYLVPEAESDNLHGTRTDKGSRYDFDGGHAMLFEKLDGTRMIALHSPNKTGLARPMFLPY